MTKIILTGAKGRMGQAIIRLLPNFKNLQFVAGIDKGDDLSSQIKNCDVLIDFTGAAGLTSVLKSSVANKKAIVIGSTGLSEEQKKEIEAAGKVIPVLYSPNMSVGVNTMWQLIKNACAVLGDDYKIEIVETHHVHKKDAPSGTAKKMKEIVCHSRESGNLPNPIEGDPHFRGDDIEIKSIREGEVVGEHSIIFKNDFESLEITHHAFTRDVFANGALKAAEWIAGKKPEIYDMGDVLKL